MLAESRAPLALIDSSAIKEAFLPLVNVIHYCPFVYISLYASRSLENTSILRGSVSVLERVRLH